MLVSRVDIENLALCILSRNGFHRDELILG
jgi:hypothetical protein